MSGLEVGARYEGDGGVQLVVVEVQGGAPTWVLLRDPDGEQVWIAAPDLERSCRRVES